MSTWHNSAQWQPPLIGWAQRTEVVPFLAWLAPAAGGILMIAVQKALTGSAPPQPQHLSELGGIGAYLSTTLLFAPLWGFPAIVAAFPLRAFLLNRGLFGWASALIAGTLAGIAVPALLGRNLWLAGPLYGAAYLWMQYVIYKLRFPDTFAP